MTGMDGSYEVISSQDLATLINQDEELLLIDSRSFLEFNTCNISNAVNVCCSKLVKRRLQQGKLLVRDLLSQADVIVDQNIEIVVYDQCTEEAGVLAADCFLRVILNKLALTFSRVRLLQGGFLEFQANHPSLCESKSVDVKSAPLTSMSQPCMPVSNVGPTRILPFLYLGSQNDALSEDTIKVNGITYVLNVSISSPRPVGIPEGHFMRVSVNDNYTAQLLPHFQQAFQFLNKVREASGCVLVHCLAGVSRSPTMAIAYLMRHLDMTCDEAYRYVKEKRPTISPNFNFLGQLLEYEKKMKRLNDRGSLAAPTPPHLEMDIISSGSATCISTPQSGMQGFSFKLQTESSLTAQSPTSALAKLTFGQPCTPEAVSPAVHITAFPTTSLDQLNFTPCLAKDESALLRVKASPAARRPHSTDAISSKPDTAMVGSDKLKISVQTTGAKRPHSISLMETTITSGVSKTVKNDSVSPLNIKPLSRSPIRPTRSPIRDPSPGDTPYTKQTLSKLVATKRPLSSDDAVFCLAKRGDNWTSKPDVLETSTQVKLRSPKGKSKQNLVRPNSIAFSSYPTSEFEDVIQTSERNISNRGNSERNYDLPSKTFKDKPTSSKSTHEDLYNISSSVENILKKSKIRYRKSKSLEDILSSPEGDCEKVDCHHHHRKKSHKHKHSTMVADLFSPTVGLDNVQCHCRGTSDPHQSSSSISSSGSHNSLHGSLEIIQVS